MLPEVRESLGNEVPHWGMDQGLLVTQHISM